MERIRISVTRLPTDTILTFAGKSYIMFYRQIQNYLFIYDGFKVNKFVYNIDDVILVDNTCFALVISHTIALKAALKSRLVSF